MRGDAKKSTFEKIPIGKAEKWLVDSAKEVGLDIEGFEHEITNDFVVHVMRHHGNEKSEAARGQIAITKEDFDKIPEVIKKPDYVIGGGKYTRGKSKGKDFLSYAKKLGDGTTLYFEEVLDGKDNRTLRGKTMYKRKGDVDEQKFLNIVSSTSDVDMSNAKKISLAATGGYPGLNPTTKESVVVANPTQTQGSSKISHESGEKSSSQPKEKPEILLAKKIGYVQGVCECVAAIGEDHALGKKLLTEMNVTKAMAKKYANPETYKALEQGIFVPQQKQEQTHSRKL